MKWLLLSLILVVLAGCSKEDELKLELPIYGEPGTIMFTVILPERGLKTKDRCYFVGYSWSGDHEPGFVTLDLAKEEFTNFPVNGMATHVQQIDCPKTLLEEKEKKEAQ